MFDELNSKA